MMDLLLLEGADINARGFVPSFRGNTALDAAVRLGDTALISALLERGAQPTHGAIGIAIQRLDLALLALLLDYDPDLTGYCAFCTLANTRIDSSESVERTLDIAALLAPFGIDTRGTSSSLRGALSRQNEALADYLFEAAGDVNGTDSLGGSLLYYAVSGQSIQTTVFLLERGADPNLSIPDAEVPPALFRAVEVRSSDLIDLLVKAGADVSVTFQGRNAAQYLVDQLLARPVPVREGWHDGYVNAVERLLAAGVDASWSDAVIETIALALSDTDVADEDRALLNRFRQLVIGR